MTSATNIASKQFLNVENPSQNWQNIVWREWATCEDEIYAQNLFELVRTTRLGWGGRLSVTLVGALYGLLVGCLFGLTAINWQVFAGPLVLHETLPFMLAWMIGLAGGLIGLGFSWWLTWQMWLNALTPNVFSNRLSGLAPFNAALLVGFVTSLAGLHLVWSILLGILAAVIMLDVSQQGNISSGLLSGLFKIDQKEELLAIALISGIGAIIGGVFTQGGWTGLIVGVIVGSWIGVTWNSGLLGILVTWVGVIIGLILGLDNWVVGWLGLGIGFGLGLVPNLVGRISFARAYQHRPYFFWWHKQPPAYKVELALRLAQQDSLEARVWAELLSRVAQQKERSHQPDSLITALHSSDWMNRFVARQALITMGGEATEALKNVTADRSNPAWDTAIWVLTSIERETTNRFAWRTAYILCPHCLTRFDARPVSLWWGVNFTYYGCRLCGQSRTFLDCPQGVVAALDTGWLQTQSYRHRRLRVNWLTRRTLFDFDWVEIVQATDEDVERFAVQVGNDTDLFRKPHYQTMPCFVNEACELSENSLRILERMFGQVAQVSEVTSEN